ncbi:MAG TPA: AMP-binding protein, partial [Polyangiales bacterium]|nr:AMP-binding protein [Polyangiales bacterium]
MAMMSMGRVVSWHAAQDPDLVSITCEGVSLTRRELDLRTNRLARAYEQLGVGQDDMVTVALPNSIAFFEAAIAIWKLGATLQPVSSKLPAAERRAIIELANSKLVVGAPPDECEGRAVVDSGFVPDSALSDEPLPDRVPLHWKAPTSGGSTGRPKIILAQQRGQTDPDKLRFKLSQLVAGPLFHNGPLATSMNGLFGGGHLVVMPRFDAEDALRLIERHRIEYVMLVPTMMQRIWRLGPDVRARYDVSSLVRLLHLAAPCPVWLKEAFIEWLGPERVHELYAGTEAQGLTTITGTEWLLHRGSVGKAALGTELKILDEHRRELPPGQVGEVFMKPSGGQGSTYRYIGAEPKSHEGFESLGDMGHLDEDGYLYLADRQTDMILCGGENVYPAEVEAAIDAHPSVRSSAVIGLPNEDLGNAIHAIVDIAEHELSDDELLAHLAQ